MDEEEITLEHIQEQINRWGHKSTDGNPFAVKMLAKWEAKRKEFLTPKQPEEVKPEPKKKYDNGGYGKICCIRTDKELDDLYAYYHNFQMQLMDGKGNKRNDRSKIFREVLIKGFKEENKKIAELINKVTERNLHNGERVD